uniref:Uncharacterized protein LOC111111383 n=1 Tax=Crassostrea virginica TaxID=6565 RepID=A0A8B8BMH5_CRAVI|nr:uncharacterized protein LOC111111383 [Crassostrea virginica]
MGLVTTFPTLGLTKGSQQHPTSSGQSHGVVTKIIRMYTLSKKKSLVRSDNITDLNTHNKTSPTILQISTTTRQKTEFIQHTPSTGVASDLVETRENESKIGNLLFGRTTDSPINQSVSPFFDSKYSPGIVPSTRSKFINKEHSSTNYVVPSSKTLYLVSTADGRDLLSTKSNVDVVDSSMSAENNYIPDSSSTETLLLKSTLPVLKLDPITTDTLNGLSLTLLCIIGVLFLLVCSLIVLAVVQKMKIKRLSTARKQRERYNPIAEMVDWKSENHPYLDLKQSHITTDKTKNLPNDYMYSFIEECNKDAKQLNVLQLQAEAKRRSFSPDDLTELQEKADYIEMLPDRISYCQDTTTFQGNSSNSCYSQIIKKRDDKIVNTETESIRMSLKQGSSEAFVTPSIYSTSVLSGNDDENSGLSRSVSSETGNVSVSKCEIIMVGKFDNDVYEDLPI